MEHNFTLKGHSERNIVFLVTAMMVIYSAYMFWRIGLTINWVGGPATVGSLLLCGLEVRFFLVTLKDMILYYRLGDDKVPKINEELLKGKYKTVILIPTFKEDKNILIPTIWAAKGVENTPEVWVLDDSNRKEIKALAQSLEVNYLARIQPENAKAGNINNALKQIEADYVLIVDADHIVHPKILSRTLPFFENPKVAIVQTPLAFYNVDSFEHTKTFKDGKVKYENLEDMFHRVIQPARNRFGGAFFAGTNAVLRVSALKEIGGIATETSTEDYLTTLRLMQKGHQLRYVNEVLSLGLAAENYDVYSTQRFRWVSGNGLSIIEEKFLRKGKMTWIQKLLHYELLDRCVFFPLFKLMTFLLPVMFVFLPLFQSVKANPLVFSCFNILIFVLQLFVFKKIMRNTGNPLKGHVFEAIQLWPLLRAAISIVMQKKHRFIPSSKGRTDDQRKTYGPPAFLYCLLFLNLLSCVYYVHKLLMIEASQYQNISFLLLGIFWSGFNSIVVFQAMKRIRTPLFGSEKRHAYRFAISFPVKIGSIVGRLKDLSLEGCAIESANPTKLDSITIPHYNLDLPATIVGSNNQVVRLKFKNLSTSHKEQLSKVIFDQYIFKSGSAISRPKPNLKKHEKNRYGIKFLGPLPKLFLNAEVKELTSSKLSRKATSDTV